MTASTSTVVDLVPSGDEGSEADVERAAAAVAAVRSSLPYPDQVVDCLVQRAAADREVLGALLGDHVGRNEVVLRGLAACTVAVEGAPRFVDGLQADAHGTLTATQLACAAHAYAALSPAELQAITGALLNSSAAGGADDMLAELMAMCDIDVEVGE